MANAVELKYPVISVINDLCNMAVPSAVMGGVGYLLGRMIKQLDPYVTATCFAIVGFAGHLFNHKKADEWTMGAAVAMAVLAPYKACQMLGYPITWKTSLITSVVGIALFAFGFKAYEALKDD